MDKTGKRDLPYDGGKKALAIAKKVQKIWHVAERPKDDDPPLFSKCVEMRSLVLAVLFGRDNRDGRLCMPDPNTGEEVFLPQDP